MKVEVRCCCDPGKLLGTVELAGVEAIREGDRYTLPLRQEEPLEIGDAEADFFAFGQTKTEMLTLPIDFWSKWIVAEDGTPPVMECGLAFKSNDTPIEKLRRIPSFEEAQ